MKSPNVEEIDTYETMELMISVYDINSFGRIAWQVHGSWHLSFSSPLMIHRDDSMSR